MKKILKFAGLFLLSILIFAAVGFLYINSNDIPSYEVDNIDYEVKSSLKSIERGKILTLMLCANCHKSTDTGKLTGGKMLDAPPEFGEIYAPNITQDKAHGIGNWTDGELLFLLRTGIKKNGQYSPPYMAKLPIMADEDLNAILSFLKSADQLVSPDPTPDERSKPSFLTKLLCRVAWKPFTMPKEKIELPDSTNSIELGKYLAINLDCFSCHSADFKTNNFLNPELSKSYFGGGNKPLDKEGRIMLTSNLTPDMETGIGKWTEDEFIKAVKYGLKEGESALLYPMTPYSGLTNSEVSAIFQYLKTIPVISNKVERSLYD